MPVRGNEKGSPFPLCLSIKVYQERRATWQPEQVLSGHLPDTRMAPIWYVGGGMGDVCGETGESGIDWVIVGGESGRNHRPFNLDWARMIRNECVSACVPFFFKQVGGLTPKSGGKMLDGREWCEMPS